MTTFNRRVINNGNPTVTGYPFAGALVTPNDGADLPEPGFVRANAAGNVAFQPWGNPSVTLTLALAAGEFVPCLVKRVLATGTTATPLHVFY